MCLILGIDSGLILAQSALSSTGIKLTLLNLLILCRNKMPTQTKQDIVFTLCGSSQTLSNFFPHLNLV